MKQCLRKFHTCSIRAKHASTASTLMSTTSLETSQQSLIQSSSISVAVSSKSSPSCSTSSANTSQDIPIQHRIRGHRLSVLIMLSKASCFHLPPSRKKPGMHEIEKNTVVSAPGFGKRERWLSPSLGLSYSSLLNPSTA